MGHPSQPSRQGRKVFKVGQNQGEGGRRQDEVPQMSVFALVILEGFLGPLCLARHTRPRPCVSIVPKVTREATRGSLKGARSAQKSHSRVGLRDEGVARIIGRE